MSGRCALQSQAAARSGTRLLIAATGLDEVNIVACSIAGQIGARDSVCFVGRKDLLPTSGGADIVTGVTASAATLGNVGPGLAGVGPLASYGDLHPASKLLLTATMWIGRLEIVAVLALLRWEVWRHAHWRS